MFVVSIPTRSRYVLVMMALTPPTCRFSMGLPRAKLERARRGVSVNFIVRLVGVCLYVVNLKCLVCRVSLVVGADIESKYSLDARTSRMCLTLKQLDSAGNVNDIRYDDVQRQDQPSCLPPTVSLYNSRHGRCDASLVLQLNSQPPLYWRIVTLH